MTIHIHFVFQKLKIHTRYVPLRTRFDASDYYFHSNSVVVINSFTTDINCCIILMVNGDPGWSLRDQAIELF